MDRNHTKIGLINWIALLLAGIVTVFVTRYVNSLAGWMGAVTIGVGFLVSLISYFQMRLEERERLEKLEFDELNKAKGSSALFTQEAENFPAQRSREQFEKYFAPVFTVLLFLAQAAAIFWEWKFLEKSNGALIKEHGGVVAAYFFLQFFPLFILGQYSARLARLENDRLIRASAGYLLLNAYVSILLAAGIAIAVFLERPIADLVVSRILVVVLALVVVETIVGLILEIYRPRIKGKAPRVLYESRLVGLLGQPEGIFKTAAHTLDYQFGFKVSDTWFFKFIQKWAFAILLSQIAVLFLSTSVVFIDPGEEALLERFGKPVAGREILGPGLHLTLPWPVDHVYRQRTDQIQSFELGVLPEEAKKQEESTILWSVAHEKEENLLVATREVSATSTNTDKKTPPVNLLSVGIPVQFQITNLVAWAYNNEEPDELLKKVASREVVHYLVSADLNEIMSRGREAAGKLLRERIQAAADKHELGAKVIFVGLEDIHPPVAVAGAYEKVIGAMQTSQARILAARAQGIQINALAGAGSFKQVRQAESYKQELQVAALARAAAFTNQIPAYDASPSVYAQRRYLQTLASASASARKYVIATTNTSEVLNFNLEDKIRPDLENLMVQPKK